MKALAILLFCGGVVFGQQSPISKKVLDERQRGVQFAKTNLFKSNKVSIRSKVLDDYVEDYARLTLDQKGLKSLLSEGHEAIHVDIPYQDEILSLELIKADLYADGFNVKTTDSPETPVDYQPGLFYQGIVVGSQASMVAFSVFDNDIIGVFETAEHGNMVLGKYGVQSQSDFILYEEDNLKITNNFACEAKDPEWDALQIEEIRKILSQKSAASVRAEKCVNVYFELDYDLYKEKGSVNAATNFLSGIFNSVQTLYANENIEMKISEVYVWTKSDGYGTGSTTSALTSFRSNNASFNGDVAHLISRGKPANGGIAWVDALCTSYAYAYSWVNSTYKNFPTYSWTVNVVAHETGHVLGSPHTHSCSWPGGALDNCYTPEPSSGCSKGPAPTGGGTVMSYCHLTSYGINFNKGFGQKPGDLIRSRVNNASCLSSCGSNPTPSCNDGIKNGNETGVDCGGDCTPCVTCDDGIKNGNETGVDCGGDCAPCATCDDGIKNGNETAVDCGGDCAPCATCDDGIKNGNETGIDCGGDCGPCETDVYCTSNSNNTQYEYIQKVTFAGINNTSGKEGYGNFIAQTANVEKGKTYAISITPKFAGSAYAEHFSVWIDWNGDGDLSDAGEKVIATTGNSTITANINVPSSATNGTTRMRIAMQWNKAITNPCATLSYGEVEDYSVSISGSVSGPTCNDGVKNGNETGVDCGGDCNPCATCDDGIKNGNETGIDCGGDCTPCTTCNDGVKNGNETGIDCGGSCGPCEQSTYCNSKSTTTQYEYIKNVSFADLNNSSKGTGGYGNYIDQTANVGRGKTYSLSVTPGYNGSAYIEYIHAYIDWNADGDFSDSGEKIMAKSGTSTVKVNVTIPNSAKQGKTRLRVQMQWNKAPNGPCSILTYGEVEDYSVNIDGDGGTTPTCGDGIKNGNETGIDCGGSCSPCTTCNDGIKNGNETGIDCGGDCTPCATCNDGVQNGNETGIDCGGSCGPCVTQVNYCESKGNKTTYEWIKLVKIGSINNATGSDGGYGDYTHLSTDLSKSTSYAITLEPHYAGSAYNEGWSVYIDFNQDGDFKDSGERILHVLAKNKVTATVEIPITALSGTTRMRIQMQWNKKSGSSCEKFGWGEVEDYSVNIGGSPNIAHNQVEADPFDVTLFPNPVRDILVVKPGIKSTGTIFVNIYNVVGEHLIQRSIRGEERFDVSALQPGYYLMEFDNGSERITKQFIKK